MSQTLIWSVAAGASSGGSGAMLDVEGDEVGNGNDDGSGKDSDSRTK